MKLTRFTAILCLLAMGVSAQSIRNDVLPVLSGTEGVIMLPAPRQSGGLPLLSALKVRRTVRNFLETPIPIQTLSDLLWAAFGINRAEDGKRTAPSSYNWQDITIYVFTAEGVWIYDVEKHALLPVKEEDCRATAGMQEYVKDAPLSFVYVSDFSKMVRGEQTFSEEYKLLMGGLDAGHISQNVYLFCASEGLGCVARASVDAAAFSKRFNLPDDQHVILGQTVGYPDE